jgi:hypothetical protein
MVLAMRGMAMDMPMKGMVLAVRSIMALRGMAKTGMVMAMVMAMRGMAMAMDMTVKGMAMAMTGMVMACL